MRSGIRTDRAVWAFLFTCRHLSKYWVEDVNLGVWLHWPLSINGRLLQSVCISDSCPQPYCLKHYPCHWTLEGCRWILCRWTATFRLKSNTQMSTNWLSSWRQKYELSCELLIVCKKFSKCCLTDNKHGHFLNTILIITLFRLFHDDST